MNQIGVIQVLRALAALMVVFSHAQNDAMSVGLIDHVSFSRSTLLPWDAGVDLFFVISGFIMVYASERLFASPGGSAAFLTRRLIRIVPLYWIITAIALAIMAYVSFRLGKKPFPALSEIAASLGFFPYAPMGETVPRPLVPQGWTLNYEMFFYLVFTLFVSLPRGRAVAAVTLTLGAVVAAGAIYHPTAQALAYWSDPIILEFVFGMGLALAYRKGWRLSRRLVMPTVALALSILAVDFAGMSGIDPTASDPDGFIRLFACGIPMALLFAGLVLAQPAYLTRGKATGLLTLLGDASYALYLFHPLVIIATRKAFLATGLESTIGYWPLVLVDLPLAAGLAIALHLCVEKPITSRLQTIFHHREKKSPPAMVEASGSQA